MIKTMKTQTSKNLLAALALAAFGLPGGVSALPAASAGTGSAHPSSGADSVFDCEAPGAGQGFGKERGGSGSEDGFHPGRRGEGKGHWGWGGFHPRMLRRLDLSEDQKSKFEEFRKSHKETRKQLREDRRKAEAALKSVLEHYPVDKAALKKATEGLAALEVRKIQHHSEALAFFMENLTAEQHRKLLTLRDEWNKKRAER